MTLGAQLGRSLQPVVDLVYPPRCPLCGAALAAQGGLCADCWSGLEMPASGDFDQQSDTMPVLAATLYNDISRKIVLTFKHGGKVALAPLMARMMAGRLPDAGEDPPLLVPVPLHRWRLWRRGFNQAALLARELARMGKGELAVDALVRHRSTPSLGGLGREARDAALKGTIRVGSGRLAKVKDRNIVLVDDVLTSGATSEACIAALAEAGARSIVIACFARVGSANGTFRADAVRE